MKQIPVSDLLINPCNKIGKEWMLITAGDYESYNTMTASWGHLGQLWSLPTSVIYVRPQRYTKEFVDREEKYTLCFFPEQYRNALGYLGSHSGRHEDKVAKVGLTPVHADGTTYFAEANLVLICRKLYQAPLVEEGFLDRAVLDKNYPERDLHNVYIGAIEKILIPD